MVGVALFVHSNPPVVVSIESVRKTQVPSFIYTHAHTHTKAAASQIALLTRSQRTLFIHYLFSGSSIVAGHCEER